MAAPGGYETAIQAGSPDLPPGVVIPPGWSLLPLQRLDANGALAPEFPTTNGNQQGGGPDRIWSSHDATQSHDSSAEGSSSQPQASSSGEPVAPPNWGGSAQAFFGGERNRMIMEHQREDAPNRDQDGNEQGSSAADGSSSRLETPEGSTSRLEASAEGSSAGASLPTREEVDREPKKKDKGKGKAVAVEEVSDHGED